MVQDAVLQRRSSLRRPDHEELRVRGAGRSLLWRPAGDVSALERVLVRDSRGRLSEEGPGSIALVIAHNSPRTHA